MILDDGDENYDGLLTAEERRAAEAARKNKQVIYRTLVRQLRHHSLQLSLELVKVKTQFCMMIIFFVLRNFTIVFKYLNIV